ncbi:dynein axonemal intermediate chain 4 [Colius striatus]|uniref:dynein axonemal intermediate chain 4 n=1 Tax=Colius striatus TaxID=57412 RepID=UPI002B1DBB66|nr:dynein axonemal intermediate chain 4 [Colius striatus]
MLGPRKAQTRPAPRRRGRVHGGAKGAPVSPGRRGPLCFSDKGGAGAAAALTAGEEPQAVQGAGGPRRRGGRPSPAGRGEGPGHGEAAAARCGASGAGSLLRRRPRGTARPARRARPIAGAVLGSQSPRGVLGRVAAVTEPRAAAAAGPVQRPGPGARGDRRLRHRGQGTPGLPPLSRTGHRRHVFQAFILEQAAPHLCPSCSRLRKPPRRLRKCITSGSIALNPSSPLHHSGQLRGQWAVACLASRVRRGSQASFSSQRRVSSSGSISTRRAAGSRSPSTASTGKAAAEGWAGGNQDAVRVFDDEGKDVTPHPLFHSDPNRAAPRQGELWSLSARFAARETGFVAPFPTQQTPGVKASWSSFPRTNGSSSTSVSNTSTAEAALDDPLGPGSRQDTTVGVSGKEHELDVQVKRGEIKEELTREDLDRRVDLYLTETETLWLFYMPVAVVSVESEEAGRVLEQNRIYVDICRNRAGNDRIADKMMQTINEATKNKEVQCDKIIMEDKGTVVTSWDLYDSFSASEIEPATKAEGSRAPPGKSSTSHPTEEHNQTRSLSSDRGSPSRRTISGSPVLARMPEEEECHSAAILTSENFQQHLFCMERILMENIFQPKLAAYRQFPILTDPDVTPDTSGTVGLVTEVKQEEHDKKKKDKAEQKEAFIDPSILSDLNKTPEETVPPRLEWLWSYKCDLTAGHRVSSMTWSKVNPDLLAVGYSAFDFKAQKEGLACCWSLKNPKWPERVFRCEHGVTALDFSAASPNLLAVGMYNGAVTIYNVASCNTAALLDSSQSSNKHTGPVWQLRWVEHNRGITGDGKKERLICISADGRITEWLIQKRLDCTDLIQIKRTESKKIKLPGGEKRKSEALISQQAAGMCFDFHPKNTNIYLAGTEEGHIHKCSCSCTEQFLETYRGHKGLVYKVAWNPFSTDMFLSCSADWSIMLWHQNSQTPVLTFSSTTAFVEDIMWFPKSAFTFAAVNESRAELWDLSVSISSPVISCSAKPHVKFTAVLFAMNTNCLLVGDSRGGVSVFELQNLAAPNSNEADILYDIMGVAVAP